MFLDLTDAAAGSYCLIGPNVSPTVGFTLVSLALTAFSYCHSKRCMSGVQTVSPTAWTVTLLHPRLLS